MRGDEGNEWVGGTCRETVWKGKGTGSLSQSIVMHTHYRTAALAHPYLPPFPPPSLTYIVERDGRGRIERRLESQDRLLGGNHRG